MKIKRCNTNGAGQIEVTETSGLHAQQERAPEEGEDLIRDFMRENNVILFIKEEFEENDLENCDGKIIGTNVSQGAVMTTGDTLVFVISNLKEES